MPQLEHDFEGTPLFICVKRQCHRIFDADKEKEKLMRIEMRRREFLGGLFVGTAGSLLPAYGKNIPSAAPEPAGVFACRGRYERLAVSMQRLHIGIERPFSFLHVSDTHFTAAYDDERDKKQQTKDARPRGRELSADCRSKHSSIRLRGRRITAISCCIRAILSTSRAAPTSIWCVSIAAAFLAASATMSIRRTCGWAQKSRPRPIASRPVR